VSTGLNMNAMERQLGDIGDLPVATIVLLCLLISFILIPTKLRLGVSLFGLSIAQTAARLADLGPVVSIAIASMSFLSVMTILAVLMGDQKLLPWSICQYALTASAAISIFYVLDATDATKAVILRIQWLLLVMAASLTASAVRSQEQLVYVLKSICMGLGVGCAICLTPLIVNPASAINSGIGRFMPYGCNPNQIGITFAMTAILGAYIWLRTTTVVSRYLCGFSAALGFALLVVTVSRTAILICAVAYLPLLPVLIRRPLPAAIIVCVMCGGVWKLLGIAEDASFARFDEGLDRSEFWEIGYNEFCQRPIFGMLGVTDLPAVELDVQDNTHNAFLSVLYLGGLSIGIPVFLCQLQGLFAAIWLWFNRRKAAYDPILIGVLAACSVMHVAHGFANAIIYYPTHLWAFWNIFSIAFFTNQLHMRFAGRVTTAIPRPHVRWVNQSGRQVRNIPLAVTGKSS